MPSRRRGWGGCGCWRWPSLAAGGHPAARVRRCEAASAAPRPETLKARASGTSSSTVGAGAGRGMKARGPIPRPLPPRLAWGAGSRRRRGWGLHPAHLRFPRGRQPPPSQLPGIVGCVYGQPLCCCSPDPCKHLPRLVAVFCT